MSRNSPHQSTTHHYCLHQIVSSTSCTIFNIFSEVVTVAQYNHVTARAAPLSPVSTSPQSLSTPSSLSSLLTITFRNLLLATTTTHFHKSSGHHCLQVLVSPASLENIYQLNHMQNIIFPTLTDIHHHFTASRQHLQCTDFSTSAHYFPPSPLSGAPNDGFLSDPLKRNFRLSGVPLNLCRFILGCVIIFLSVRSF